MKHRLYLSVVPCVPGDLDWDAWDMKPLDNLKSPAGAGTHETALLALVGR